MRKSRLWTAFSAVVGLATLVVLASCQGPIGPAGKDGAGAPGAPGAAGPAGGPGDTAGPTALEAIPTPQHLALTDGTGKKATGVKALPGKAVGPTDSVVTNSYNKVVIDLNAYFTDEKTPSLSYEAVSSDTKIVGLSTSATAAGGTDLVADGKLTVTAAGVGTVAGATSAMATITVSAYDGVNAPLTKSFDVVVVKSNSAPTVAVITPIADLVDMVATMTTPASKKLYTSGGKITREFKATINPGFIGTGTTAVEDLTLRAAFVKNAPVVVKVSTPVLVGVNTYSVDITPTNPSLKNATGLAPTRVMIIATDPFGAETLVTDFTVAVNRPPVVTHDRQDVVLYREGAQADIVEGLSWVSSSTAKYKSAMYTLSEYFDDLDLDSFDTTGDTTCSFSTSPTQPTGRWETKAALANGPVAAVAAIAAAPAKVDTLALVWNGDVDRTEMDQTSLKDIMYEVAGGAADTGMKDAAMVMVDAESSATAPSAAGEPPSVNLFTTGSFMLTITCSDADAPAVSSHRITVRTGS